MDLENQCCTPEQGEQLKELGITQASLFYWTHSEKWGIMFWMSIDFKGGGAPTSCFTVAELGRMLPRYYPSWRCLEEGGQKEFWIATIIGQPEGFERDKEDVMDIRTVCAFDRYGATQAEALAALLISLLETGAVTAAEINARLCPEK